MPPGCLYSSYANVKNRIASGGANCGPILKTFCKFKLSKILTVNFEKGLATLQRTVKLYTSKHIQTLINGVASGIPLYASKAVTGQSDPIRQILKKLDFIHKDVIAERHKVVLQPPTTVGDGIGAAKNSNSPPGWGGNPSEILQLPMRPTRQC